MCWSFCSTGKKTNTFGYIRDGALHCYCCFILLTQLEKQQPTLALSIQYRHTCFSVTLMVQPIPACQIKASGDGVKTVIHDKTLGELVPYSCRSDIQSARLDCAILSAHRNSEQWPIDTSDGGQTQKRRDIPSMGPRGTSEREERVTHGAAAERQAGKLLFDQQSQSDSVALQTQPAAVEGEWMMWEVAVYSNFIFSCHSREILSGSVIAVILYIFPVCPYHPHCRSGGNSLCVPSINHPKPNQLTVTAVDGVGGSGWH